MIIRKILPLVLCSLCVSCSSISTLFAKPEHRLTDSRRDEFTQVQILFNPFSSPSESYKKKLNGKFPRSILIPLSKSDETELVSLIKRMQVKSCRKVMAKVTPAFLLNLNLLDKNGKVILDRWDFNVYSKDPEYLLNTDHYYYLDEKDAARFWEIIYSAIDAEDVYARKLNNPEGCSVCEEGEGCKKI